MEDFRRVVLELKSVVQLVLRRLRRVTLAFAALGRKHVVVGGVRVFLRVDVLAHRHGVVEEAHAETFLVSSEKRRWRVASE